MSEVHVNRQTPTSSSQNLARAMKAVEDIVNAPVQGVSATASVGSLPPASPFKPQLGGVKDLLTADHLELVKKEKEYGSSWKKRGGVGAFMMAARKWDRIETQVERRGYDIFTTVYENPSETGILDDIADLRRYLALIEDHVRTTMEITK
jgi:hypothetical protein